MCENTIGHREIGSILERAAEEYRKHNKCKTEWRPILFAVANADDSMFSNLKQSIGEWYRLPGELLPQARRVIVYFLPFARVITDSNREGEWASGFWAAAYRDTNRLIDELNFSLGQRIELEGGRWHAPPPTHQFDPVTMQCSWSHKHAAYIAGLGRFGSHSMLITDSGCCGRLGSLITDLDIPVSPRPDREFCLHDAEIPCRKCLDRCIIDAWHSGDLDKRACYLRLRENDARAAASETSQACGKCACGIPCSMTNPVRSRRNNDRIENGSA